MKTYDEFLLKPSQQQAWTSPLDMAMTTGFHLVGGSAFGFYVLDAVQALYQRRFRDRCFKMRLANTKSCGVFFAAYYLLASVSSNAVYRLRGDKRYVVDDIAIEGVSAAVATLLGFRTRRLYPISCMALLFAGSEAYGSKHDL